MLRHAARRSWERGCRDGEEGSWSHRSGQCGAIPTGRCKRDNSRGPLHGRHCGVLTPFNEEAVENRSVREQQVQSIPWKRAAEP